MRICLILLLLILSIPVFGQKAKKKLTYKKEDTYYSDLNNDGIIDTISLGISLGRNRTFNFSDRRSFNTITIKLSGYGTQTFIAKDSWAVVDRWFLDSNRNALKTNLLFLKKTPQQSVILLFGELDGAGYRGEFSIINIENNKVKLVFDHYDDNIAVEAPETLKPLESSSRLCFIYREIFEMEEPLKNGSVGAYSLYFVYPVDDSCKLNKPLTKAYNEKYYVYPGYKYSERLRVYYPNNRSKPKLLKSKNPAE